MPKERNVLLLLWNKQLTGQAGLEIDIQQLSRRLILQENMHSCVFLLFIFTVTDGWSAI